ncbi:MAG: transposase [Victivallales bacterium]|nr:transposase [Victivallales bacterium]
MGRLPGFDYKKPFFYMVTLKRLRNHPCKFPFCSISDDGLVVNNPITEAFKEVLSIFHETWWCIEPIHYYVIMPDHLHMIIKMREVEGRVSLPVVVRQLIKALERAVWENAVAERRLQDQVLQSAAPQPIFEKEWHDWIVKKEGQLAAFRKYIEDNPKRYALRRANRQFFTQARVIAFQGRQYCAYGNEALLELPVIVAIKGHRQPSQGAPMGQRALLAEASRLGPGAAGLSTFLSPLEKNAGNEIIKAGGSLIVLSLAGFGERWHPSEKQERFCAEGRMLFLSPYAPDVAKFDHKTMYLRAHELVDWALAHSNEQLEAWPC